MIQQANFSTLICLSKSIIYAALQTWIFQRKDIHEQYPTGNIRSQHDRNFCQVILTYLLLNYIIFNISLQEKYGIPLSKDAVFWVYSTL